MMKSVADNATIERMASTQLPPHLKPNPKMTIHDDDEQQHSQQVRCELWFVACHASSYVNSMSPTTLKMFQLCSTHGLTPGL